MAEMFDPAVFLVLPGTNGGSATTSNWTQPQEHGRSVECFRFKKGDRNPPAKILGWVDMNTGNVTEARCRTTTAN